MNVLVLTPYVAWPLDHGGRIRTWHLLRALAGDHRVVNLAVAREPSDRDDAQELAKLGIAVRPGPRPRAGHAGARARRLAKWVSVLLGRSSLPRPLAGRRFRGARADGRVRRRASTSRCVETPVDGRLPSRRSARLPYVASTQNVESDVLLDVARRESRAREEDRRAGRASSCSGTRRRFFAEWPPRRSRSPTTTPRGSACSRPSARVASSRTASTSTAPGRSRRPSRRGRSSSSDRSTIRRTSTPRIWLVKEVLPAGPRERRARRRGARGTQPAARGARARGRAASRSPANVPDLAPLVRARLRRRRPDPRRAAAPGMKILEALAFGRPVVTTATGMRGLAVEDGAHVLVADTPDGFVGGARAARGANPGSLRASRRRAASSCAARHAWPRARALFADVVDGRGETRS